VDRMIGVGWMSRLDKLLLKLLRGTSDASFAFDDLRYILERLGFTERITGSHHIYRRAGVEERLTLQPKGKDAKSYQVKQVRDLIVKYGIGGEE
jgi:predicted RNA binding protein YcfA (HicA-like mRNA interferase family)